jgi:signal peptidase I
VILVLIAFVFLRTMIVEPYGVPTGSMAPKFLGNHREVACPRCQHPVVVGESAHGERTVDACCPNCGKRGIELTNTWEIPGDRLMVDKNVFNARRPRRWEIAVFRCPVDLTKPYVKRVVGIPGEAIQFRGGDVYANGELVRKSLATIRETRIPVFTHGYSPANGWAARWLVEPIANDPKLPINRNDSVQRADDTILVDDTIVLDATTAERPAIGLTYRQVALEDSHETPITDWLTYNGPPRRGRTQPAHDFQIVGDLEVRGGNGSVACRLGDGLDTVKIECPIGASELCGVQMMPDGGNTPHEATGFVLQPGRTYHLEFGLIDRRATLAIDGTELFTPIDLPVPIDLATQRGGVSRPLQFGVRGVSIVLKNLVLYRDIHYRAEGINGTAKPHQLAADEFFMVGDNSANSNDSREWKIPGIRDRDFIGKPFLIHQPLRAGRVQVNGNDKAFQTVDWDRLRWVR